MTTTYLSGDEFVSMTRRRDYESIIELLWDHKDTILTQAHPYEFRNLATALLRAGRPNDAIELLEQLIAVTSPKRRGSGDYCDLGGAHWVTGDFEKAIEWWQQALGCNYGDGAKNMTPALLLFYAAVRSSDDALKRDAVSEIEGKLKTGWAKNWPAPLGRFLVGAEGNDHVKKALLSQHPLRQPDESCRFDFYQGVKHVEAGHEVAAKTCFQSAFERPEQKTISTEFVLARHELEETPTNDAR